MYTMYAVHMRKHAENITSTDASNSELDTKI